MSEALLRSTSLHWVMDLELVVVLSLNKALSSLIFEEKAALGFGADAFVSWWSQSSIPKLSLLVTLSLNSSLLRSLERRKGLPDRERRDEIELAARLARYI